MQPDATNPVLDVEGFPNPTYEERVEAYRRGGASADLEVENPYANPSLAQEWEVGRKELKPAKPNGKAKPAAKIEPVTITKPAKAPSMSNALKAIVVREPKITVDELVARLEQAGFKGRSKVTISTLRSDALTTLAAAKEAGLYNIEM